MSERYTENSLELITCSEEESQVDIKEKKEIKQKKVNYKEYIKICAKISVCLMILGVICFLLFAPKKKNLMENIPLGDSDSSFKEIISKSKTIQTEDQLKLLSSGLSNTEVFKGKMLYEVNIDLIQDDSWKNPILEERGSVVFGMNGNGAIYKNNRAPIISITRAIYDIYTQKQTGILIMNISELMLERIITGQ
ncbi:MAG: hypothetical protein MJ252_26485, partial [archaeon]|nr:hypothetical protein [archaeon]